MKLTQAEKLRLSTFLIVGATLLGGSIATLAGLRLFQERDAYFVHFTDSVSGLEVSSQVRYQGLRVGAVQAMHISPKDPTAIEVELALEPGTVLTEGTTAVLDLSGITGLKTVNLVPGDPKKPVLPPGSEIPVGSSFFDKITGRAEQIAEKVESIANNLARWTSDDNRQRFEDLMTSFNELAIDFDVFLVDTRDPLVRALNQFEQSGEAIRETAEESSITMRALRGEVRQTLQSAQKTINEAGRLMRAVDTNEVKKSVVGFRRVVERLSGRLSEAEFGRLIKNMSQAMEDLTRVMQDLDLAVRSGREDFVLSLKHIRQASEDLREFSRIIAQDPSVLLRGAERQQ